MLEINNTRCSDIHFGAGHPVLRWGMVSMSVGFQEDGWYALLPLVNLSGGHYYGSHVRWQFILKTTC